MKRLFYLAMFFLGLNILITSCEKMDGGNYSGASSINKELLGKWLETKTEYSFNGKVVGTLYYDKPDEYSFYDNGSCVIYQPDNDSWYTTAYAYDKSSNVIYLQSSKYNVLETTNNTAKLSFKWSLKNPNANGVKKYTYEGIDIYYDDLKYDYYYVKNGRKISVRHYQEDGKEWWSDTLIIYFERAK